MNKKKRYVQPAVTCYQIEVQQQMMAGSVLDRTEYGDGSSDWDQSYITGRSGYGDGSSDWDQSYITGRSNYSDGSSSWSQD